MFPPGLSDGAQVTPSPAPAAFLYTSLLPFSTRIFIHFLFFSLFIFFFFLGRRLQRSRRSGCCHGNSRCRNSFGLSLGNPSWSCQATGSRGGTRDFGRDGCSGHKWEQCLPEFCCLQSRVQGGERVGKASAVKGTQQAVSLCVWSLPFPPIPPRLHGSKPALPSCAAYPQHRALSLLPFDDGISTGGSSKSCQVAEKKLEAFRGAVTEPGREHRVCSLQGDAGFWVILESIRVVPRKKISKSLLTTSAFVSFCIYSWFVAKHSCFIPQKDSVLEITGNIGTLGMRFQESTFSSALPNKTWIC